VREHIKGTRKKPPYGALKGSNARWLMRGICRDGASSGDDSSMSEIPVEC